MVRAHRMAAVAAATLLVLGLVLPVAQANDKVTICHRTASHTNPYVQITVDSHAVDGLEGDHATEHQGPVFYKNIPKHTEWGDIIPPGVVEGYNWNADGRAIWNNNCNLTTTPDPDPTPTKVTWKVRTLMPYSLKTGVLTVPAGETLRGRLVRHCGYMVAKMRSESVSHEVRVRTGPRTLVHLYFDGVIVSAKIGKAYTC